MDPTPNAAPEVPKFPPILRAIGIAMLIGILWSVDKVVVGRLPQGSVWRYIIGAIVISAGLAAVLSFTDRLNRKES